MNLRGFDNRHDSITLSNAVLDVTAVRGPVSARVALQVGTTPDTYYAFETVAPGAGLPTSADSFRHVQQAYASWNAGALTAEAGLFLSPVGIEGIAVRDNLNWSRSNLFVGLPFYHSGARVIAPVGPLTVTGAVFNGWNCIVDNNRDKSVVLQAAYKGPVTASLLYFGGNERPAGAPEGRPWRHLVDANVTWDATDRITLAAHANAGQEENRVGTSGWTAAAGYARVRVLPVLWIAARGDVFQETVAEDAGIAASSIFWPVESLSSVTGTVGIEPAEGLSIRLEFRHDTADADAFYEDDVAGDGFTTPFTPNAKTQDTFTIGVVAGF